jgi:hypothetical protein
MQQLIITIMDIHARWQRLPESNLSLRRRREVQIYLFDYATFDDRKLPLGRSTAYTVRCLPRTFPVHNVHIRGN